MGNCLVTKLNGVVSDDSLPRLNEVTLAIKTGQQTLVELPSFAPNTTTAYLENSNSFPGGGQTSGPGNNSVSANIVEDGYYRIQNKYSLTGIWRTISDATRCNEVSLNLSEIEYCTQLQILNIGSKCDLVGDLSSFANLAALWDLEVASATSLTGDLSSISGLVNLKKLDFQRASHITGSVSSFSQMTVLEGVWLRYCPGIHETDDSIAAFAAAQVANGRTSGTLKIECAMNNDVPGISFTSKTITFNSSLPNGYSIS